jgi:hypothetical protein
MVTNGGFEGGTGWTQSPAGVVTTSGLVAARTGTWKALLGGQGADQTESVTQSVTIPSGCTASLSYYLRVTTLEITHPFDFFRVQVGGVTLQSYSDADAGASYVLRTVDLSAYAGQTVSLTFLSDEDGSIISTFYLDDVSLTGTAIVAPVVAASGGTSAHTENVPLAVDTGITVTDADSANMASGTVTVGSGYTAGQDVLAFTNQNGITGSYSAPTLTLTGSATKANWQTALRSITYNNTSNTPNTGNRTINFVVNDGSVNSNTGARTVSVAAANDAPVNSVPGAQTTAVNTAKVFSTGNGNLISVTDVDAAGGTMQVQLVSTNGATTLSTLAGLAFSVGDGTADATMTFTGSFAAVNTALAGLSFNPTASFTGAASLQVVTGDQGNSGTGGTLTDTDTIAITVGTSYFDLIWGTSSLVSYWRLGEASGTSMADSKGASGGTYFGTPTLGGAGAVTGNTAMQVNGSSQYATAPRPVQDDFSIEFWFKSSQVAGSTCTQWWQGMRLVDAEVGGGNSDFGVSLCAGKIIGGVGSSSDVSIVTPGTYNNNVWHHVVFTRTRSPAAMQLYVDGAFVIAGTPNNTGSLTASSILAFGRAPDGSGFYYSGLLDEVAVYSTVLSAAAVTAHYNAAP